MKFISKGPEPEELIAFKIAGDEDWPPEYGGLPGDKKRAIHDALLDDQGHICCYCMRRVHRDSSHIEHWIPQSKDERSALDYENMLTSCQREVAPGEPLTRGQKKGNWYDPATMVSPLTNECEDRFRFTAAGDIVAVTGDEASAQTVSRLGLDLPGVVAGRREAIGAVIDGLEEMSLDDLRALSRGILERDERGEFAEYCVAIVHIVRALIP